VGEGGRSQFQIRTPIDDTHTYHVWYRTKARAGGAPLQDPATIPVLDYAYKHEDGRLVVDTVSGQDMMVWVTQGPISDRTTERLGTTDKGVIMYRALLEEQMLKVERGEEPMAVVRDPAKNTPMIEIRRERNPFQVSAASGDMFALRKELAATRG
jgi:5,5'-dehydrodivanillate O-demethylase